MDFVFSFLCHQIPERSPYFDGETFPLCFRCAGLYFGIITAYLYLILSGGLHRSMPGIPCLIPIAMLMLPFVVDGWGNTLHLWNTPGWIRLLSGLAYGVVLPLLLVPLRAGDDPFCKDLKPSLTSPKMMIMPIGIGFLFVTTLLHPISRLVFQSLSVLALLGFLVFAANFLMTLINSRATFRQIGNRPLNSFRGR